MKAALDTVKDFANKHVVLVNNSIVRVTEVWIANFMPVQSINQKI